MQMPEITKLFSRHFMNKEFDSVESYNAEVLKFANSVREEVAQTERNFLTKPDAVERILNVKVGGENATSTKD